MSELDTALAAYGDSLRRAHRPIDPRAIIAADGGRAVDERRNRGHLLLAVAACVAVLLGTVAVVRVTSSPDPTPLDVGGVPAPATICGDLLSPDGSEIGVSSMPPGSVQITNPPQIDPEDRQPRHRLYQHTSPDGLRTVTVDFVPAGDPYPFTPSLCGQTPLLDRPMLDVRVGSDPGDSLLSDPHWDPPAALVEGMGASGGESSWLLDFRVQPQVASVELDVRQHSGDVATETFEPQRSWLFIPVGNPTAVLSDLRAYDADGELLGTLDRRWFATL